MADYIGQGFHNLSTSIRDALRFEALQRQQALQGRGQELEQERALEQQKLTGAVRIAGQEVALEEAKGQQGYRQAQIGLEGQRVDIARATQQQTGTYQQGVLENQRLQEQRLAEQGQAQLRLQEQQVRQQAAYQGALNKLHVAQAGLVEAQRTNAVDAAEKRKAFEAIPVPTKLAVDMARAQGATPEALELLLTVSEGARKPGQAADTIDMGTALQHWNLVKELNAGLTKGGTTPEELHQLTMKSFNAENDPYTPQKYTERSEFFASQMHPDPAVRAQAREQKQMQFVGEELYQRAFTQMLASEKMTPDEARKLTTEATPRGEAFRARLAALRAAAQQEAPSLYAQQRGGAPSARTVTPPAAIQAPQAAIPTPGTPQPQATPQSAAEFFINQATYQRELTELLSQRKSFLGVSGATKLALRPDLLQQYSELRAQGMSAEQAGELLFPSVRRK